MNTPYISIVIATYNRQRTLSKVIEDLLAQELSRPFNYEIIIVDNNSTDQTKEVVENLIPRSAGKLKYFKQEVPGKVSAVNMGILESKGEIIAFTDDDVTVDPHWLALLEQCFRENHCDAVGGRVLPVYPDNTPLWVRNNPSKIAGGVVIYDYGEETIVFDPSRYRFIGANFAFRKQIFNECGYFKEDYKYGSRIPMGEDTELVERLIKRNKVLYYCGKALIYHPVDLNRLTLRHAARWNMTLGRFAAQQEEDNKEMHFVYWFGVPKYLWRGVIIDSFRLCASIFDHFALYNACRSFFRKVGMISEYRRMIKEGKIR